MAGHIATKEKDILLKTFPDRRKLRPVKANFQEGMNVEQKKNIDTQSKESHDKVNPFALLGMMDKQHNPHQKQ
jgi:hypothetical protein